MPRCVVNENFKVFHGHSPVMLEAGQVITGSLAELLLRTARGKVTAVPDEQPADDDGQELVHRDPCVDGNVCGGPHCPPESVPQDGVGGSQEPPPSDDPQTMGTELDIEAKADDVLAWVGEDAERASEALRQEQARDKPRSTLLKQLAKLADA
ncbi:hypothetical protein [Streptomyces chartreusis]|uniref:hypothetical protein n=1 Tax=Streptomyces chartreusis TaxID=1969 RepID=UPI003819FAA3